MPDIQSIRSQPGTQREYETIFIVRPEAETATLQALNDRVKRIVDEAKGKPLRVENWGKRKLAYEIKKCNRGIYLYWRYLAQSSTIAELERNLRLSDNVIRFLTVRVDEDVDPNARPTDLNEETFVAASTVTYEEESTPEPSDEPYAAGDDLDEDFEGDYDDDAAMGGEDEGDDVDSDDDDGKTSEYRTVGDESHDDEEN